VVVVRGWLRLSLCERRCGDGPVREEAVDVRVLCGVEPSPLRELDGQFLLYRAYSLKY